MKIWYLLSVLRGIFTIGSYREANEGYFVIKIYILHEDCLVLISCNLQLNFDFFNFDFFEFSFRSGPKQRSFDFLWGV